MSYETVADVVAEMHDTNESVFIAGPANYPDEMIAEWANRITAAHAREMAQHSAELARLRVELRAAIVALAHGATSDSLYDAAYKRASDALALTQEPPP